MWQAIADGILSGAIIALGAIGVSLGMHILRFANFSHSELVSWGAYVALALAAFAGVGDTLGPLSFGWKLLAAMLVAGALTGLLAVLVDTFVFARLRHRFANPLTLVFAAFGAALILRNVLLLVWGPEVHYYTRELQISLELLPGVRMLPDQIFVLGFTVAAVICLHAFLRYSRMGIAMRGMAENHALARTCGVRVETVIRATWIVSGMLAAMAGVFLGVTSQLRPEMGFNMLLSMFTAAILGGVGSLPGALLGGLAVGLAENVSVLFLSAGYKQAMPFALLILALYFRPQGLFGAGERP